MMIAAGIAALLLLATSLPEAAAQPFADCDVATYYASLPTTPSTAARGDMHALLRTTHRAQLPYTSTAYGDVWDALIDVDSDPSGQNVRLVYADTFVPATPYDAGTCEYWNREHIWSRSRGVDTSGKDNTDLHHLRPADCNVNSARSNLYFASCGTAAPSNECMVPAHPEAAGDTAKDGMTFLPPVGRRGDVARAILYMDLRYDGGEGTTTLDLVVSDCPETVPDKAGMGYLSQLLQWHMDDPPDDEERARNEKVCADWQGNRNPFVDFPELAFVYHGGPRPLLGDGLGYNCTVPPPPAGTCSDGSGPCASTDECGCAPSARSRNLLGGSSPRKLETSKLIITGVFDGPLAGGLPKMVELYATETIADLSAYGVGSANNGGGSDGQEFTLSGSATAGSFITVSAEAVEYGNYFGESPTFTSGSVNVNGDDAIELFFNGGVVDSYGEASVDGTGTVWEYMDGWAYRQAGSTPGGAFQLGEWNVSGKNAVDGCTVNDSCGSAFPLKTFTSGGGNPTKSPTPEPTSNPTQASQPGTCECLLPFSPTPPTTPNPTAVPTTSPVASTGIPTAGPTLGPSVSPTRPPSTSPTMSPSLPPTAQPTATPTHSPSKPPTMSPSNAPTSSPSRTPSLQPTTSPSRVPTSSPLDPTNSPSRAPSSNPTRAPSGSPSTKPDTSSPSASPTKAPSSSPINPTNNPTANPSKAPSPKPFSDSPTTNPMTQPSSSPSKSPTPEPFSASPTKSPTASPVDPTNSPSRMPTTSPDIVGQCSDEPSNTCTETNLSQCSCANRRYLIKGREQTASIIGLRGIQSRRKLKPKKTPEPTQSATIPRPPTASPSGSPSRPPTTPPSSNPTTFECTCLFPTPEPTQSPTTAVTSDPTTSPSPGCICSAYTARDNCKAACGGSTCNWTGNPKTCGPV